MATTRIDSYSIRRTANVGDLSSVPMMQLARGQAVRYCDVEAPLPDDPAGTAIIGGGGLFQHWIQIGMKRVFDAYPILVVWGVGVNGYKHDRYPPWIDCADLVGVRDWAPWCHHRWVPCASCMHSAFDHPRAPVENYVVFEHIHQPVDARLVRSLGGCNDLRVMNNQGCTIEQAVEHLSLGCTVLTTSYHGAYWATLLGRKVIVWPWSSKFLWMRHPPHLMPHGEDDVSAWSQHVEQARVYPEALQECRQATLAFADDVRNLIRARGMG